MKYQYPVCPTVDKVEGPFQMFAFRPPVENLATWFISTRRLERR